MAHGASRGHDPDLVGRERELGQLGAALGDAVAGRGGLTLLTGEPGIGKTALARQLADRAARRGVAVAWGTCWDGVGAPAYWPWVQVVRTLTRRADLDALRDGIGDGAPWIVGLLPELEATLGPPARTSELDSDQGRFRLFDALAGLLAAAARRRPLLLVLDDLHWADASSLFALEFVARTLPDAPILAIAAYRHVDAHARDELAPALGGLARAGSRLPLQGLGRPDIGRLAAWRDDEPAPALVAAVHRATGGNPFFADELVQQLASQGRLAAPAGDDRPLPLPDGVREAIRRRLAPFDAGVGAALDAAAVLGGEFRLGTLAAVLDLPAADVLRRLEPPLRAGLLVAPDEPGRFSFAHALVRDTLLEGLGTARRARLHAAAGEALERLHADDLDARLPELAYHFLRAAAEGGAERAVAYAERAADRALSQFAYDEAARLYAQAIAAAEPLEPCEQRAWRLAQGLGEARMRAGDSEGARSALAGAAVHARRLGDPRRLAQAALADILWGFSPGIVETEIVALLEEALERVDALGATDPEQRAADDALRVRLRVRLAMALYWSPARDRRQRLVDEAVALARDVSARPEADRLTADRTLAFALAQGFVAVWGPDTLEQGLPASREAVEICERTSDPELALQIRSWRASLLLELDDPIRADEEIETYGRLARRLGQPRTLLYDPLHRSMRAHLRGDFAAAERHTDEAVAQAERVPGSVGLIVAGAQRFFTRRTQGRHLELEPFVRQAAHGLPAMRAWRCGLALVLAELGRETEARSELEHLAARDFDDLPRDLLWLVACSMLAELCVLLDDRPRAQRLYDLMAPYESRNVVSLEAAYVGPVSRFLGLLAMTLGEHERALGHLETARAAAERIGARPTAVLAALDAAEVLARRSGPGDLERGRGLVARAEREATALDMEGATARAEILRARMGGEEPRDAHAHVPGPVPAVPMAAPADGHARLERRGDVWTLDYAGRSVHLQDAKGMRQLAVLLATPHVEVRAAELAVLGEGPPPAPRPRGAGADALRARVAALREELDEARDFNDPERAALAMEELEEIAAGLQDRARAGSESSPQDERDRVNVTRAIRSAVRRITEHDAEIGRLLQTTVRTGACCAYEPDPTRPVEWDVAA